jgi:hypothetical protein
MRKAVLSVVYREPALGFGIPDGRGGSVPAAPAYSARLLTASVRAPRKTVELRCEGGPSAGEWRVSGACERRQEMPSEMSAMTTAADTSIR